MITKTDAMNAIREALDEFVNDFDTDAMFDELYRYDEATESFVENDNVDFWAVANKYDMTADQAEEVWEGEGWYNVAYTDGGMPATSDGPIWCDSINDLAGLFSMANHTKNDWHMPYAEFQGNGDEPEEM